MRILHIAANDLTSLQIERLAQSLKCLATAGIEQYLASIPDDALQTAADESSVPVIPFKFGGLFDLRTLHGLQEAATAFSPHIVQSHSVESAIIAARALPHAMHVGFLSDRDRSTILKFCQYGIQVNYLPHARSPEPDRVFIIPPFAMDEERAVKSLLQAYQVIFEKRDTAD